jgi:multicomponent Na+:H+ antiporter subunit E
MKTGTHSLAGAALTRALMFFAMWIVLMPSVKPGDLALGLITTGAATWTSLHLLSREEGYVHFRALLRFVPHFLWQSVLAGVDVARRALVPRMPLKTGFIVCPVSFPPGLARNEFASIMSLMPGSLPVDESEDSIVFHCLDTDQPLASQMAREERLLADALVPGEHHG